MRRWGIVRYAGFFALPPRELLVVIETVSLSITVLLGLGTFAGGMGGVFPELGNFEVNLPGTQSPPFVSKSARALNGIYLSKL